MGFILGVVRAALESKPIAYRVRVLLLVIVTGGSSGGGGGIVVVGIGARGAAPHGDKIWIGLVDYRHPCFTKLMINKQI